MSNALSLSDCLGQKKGASSLVRVAKLLRLSIYSENKGAYQLRGYRESDLRLRFRICKMLVFS